MKYFVVFPHLTGSVGGAPPGVGTAALADS